MLLYEIQDKLQKIQQHDTDQSISQEEKEIVKSFVELFNNRKEIVGAPKELIYIVLFYLGYKEQHIEEAYDQLMGELIKTYRFRKRLTSLSDRITKRTDSFSNLKYHAALETMRGVKLFLLLTPFEENEPKNSHIIYKRVDRVIENMSYVDDEKSFILKGFLGVDGELNDRYFTVYKKYKMLLDRYLAVKFPLKKYDDLIHYSGLRFIPLSLQDLNPYQFLSFAELNYIYLVNDLQIVKLPEEDIKILASLPYRTVINPDKMAIDLIFRTYNDIIYNSDTESNKLIFGIRSDDWADNGLSDVDERNDNYDKQQAFLHYIAQLMEDEFGKLCGQSVAVQLYNELNDWSSIYPLIK